MKLRFTWVRQIKLIGPNRNRHSALFILGRSYVAKTPEAEEEDKILESYLVGMKIEDGHLVLPPVSERPDGFDLFYQRRSLIEENLPVWNRWRRF